MQVTKIPTCRAGMCPDLKRMQSSLLSVLTVHDAMLHVWLMLLAEDLHLVLLVICRTSP